ncbi:unnamed protein product [Sphagnum balticum]
MHTARLLPTRFGRIRAHIRCPPGIVRRTRAETPVEIVAGRIAPTARCGRVKATRQLFRIAHAVAFCARAERVARALEHWE